jgi:hypothetical protein
MKMTVKEVKALMRWLSENYDNGVRDSSEVRLELTQTGIGATLEAKVTTKECEGLWIDLTDYDSW